MKKLLLTSLLSFVFLVSNSYAESSYLNFAFKIPRTCKFGDYDSLRQDMMWSDNPKLLFSLVDIETGKEYSQELLTELKTIKEEWELKVFMEQFMAGSYHFSVKVPESSGAKRYMAILCKDSLNTNKCSDKVVRPIGDIMNDYASPPSDFKSKNNVYFYRPLVVQDGEVGMDDGNNLPANYRKTVDIIKSLPIEKVDGQNRLVVKLPYFDPQKCGQELK